MELEHGAQGRESGKGVCDGCRLILSAAVGGVNFLEAVGGCTPVVFWSVNKWICFVGFAMARETSMWKAFN
jgi:hypothetical protein